MATATGSITRAATRQDGEPLNVLTAPCHERYQSGLAKVNANFYMLRCPQVKDWDSRYAKLPANHHLLSPSRGDKQLPPDIDFDVVLAQNVFSQYQILSAIAKQLHLPLVRIEHTLVHPSWTKEYVANLAQMRGDINAFISELSVGEWGFSSDDPSVRVIHHGVDTDTFCPNDMVCDRKPTVLSVVNDLIVRNWCCGYDIWKAVVKDLPFVIVGDTPGLSLPAKSLPDLVMKYRSSRVFLNTSTVSPIPTALLEGMASGCACVSTSNGMIASVIEHGVNGLMSNDPKELRSYCDSLLRDESLSSRLGAAARRTIVERFGMNAFVANWDRILREAAEITYLGAK